MKRFKNTSEKIWYIILNSFNPFYGMPTSQQYISRGYGDRHFCRDTLNETKDANLALEVGTKMVRDNNQVFVVTLLIKVVLIAIGFAFLYYLKN